MDAQEKARLFAASDRWSRRLKWPLVLFPAAAGFVLERAAPGFVYEIIGVELVVFGLIAMQIALIIGGDEIAWRLAVAERWLASRMLDGR